MNQNVIESKELTIVEELSTMPATIDVILTIEKEYG